MNEKQKLAQYWVSNNIIVNENVIAAFLKISREKFMKDEDDEAYEDSPASIGEGQTISQPTTVMLMTQSLEVKKGQKVLEIGSGSGYQAAIISQIIGEKGRVISTEIIEKLARFARNNLKKAGIKNVEVFYSDGSKGYENEAPYDRIIVTAATPQIPQNLIDQLKEDGILIAPVGSLKSQTMIKLMKKDNKIIKENLGDFIFVPMRGEFGFE